MKRGTKIALIAGISTSIVLSSALIVLNKEKVFPKVNAANISETSLFLINKERTSRSLKPLSWNEQLKNAAEAKANDMFANNYFDHTSPKGTKAWHIILESGYSYKYAGENLAIDFDKVEQAVEAWKKSPTHMENIISEKYSDYAIVEKEGVLNGQKAKVYVQLFATK